MCTSCRGRGFSTMPPAEAHSEPVTPEADLAHYLHGRFSRGQVLRGAGAGLALTLVAGSLGWKAFPAVAEPLYLVLIVLDGARPEYFSVPGIPHVSSLIRNGTQYTNAFAGILESETPSGHASIATGSQPRHNGILSFAWANGHNVEVDLFDPDKIRAGDMEKIMRKSRVPTLASLVHARNPRATVVALSGHKYYAADAIGGPEANIIMYYYGTSNGLFVPTYIPGHAPPSGILNAPGLAIKNSHVPLGVENHLAMKLAVTTFQRTKQQVTLINLPEFDWPLGHVDGGTIDPRSVKTLMQSFDRDLAMLQDAYRKAGVLDRTLFVLTADHGMMPLYHKVDANTLANAVTKAGTSLVEQTYSSGVYLWLKDASRAGQAAQNIVNLRNPYIQSVYVMKRSAKGYAYYRVSSAALLRTAGVEAANQALLQSFAGPNGPDVVVLFAEGAGSEPGGQASWKADHGGASWQAQHIPLVFSGPGVRSGQVSSYPARLMDIAPTALQLMGVPHKGMQGIPLADAMQAPPAWAVRWQQGRNRYLLPHVQALQQESRLELAARL